MFLPRGLSEEEFKRLTVKEYLDGGYGVNKQTAEELAQTEWEIRQEVENHTRVKKVELKEKSERQGFGKYGIAMHQAKEIKAGSQTLRISRTAYKALRKKPILTKEDIEWLLCGDDDFLPKHSKSLDFPPYIARFGGYRVWAVYEWLDKFQIRRKGK